MRLKEIIGPIAAQAGKSIEEEINQKTYGVLIFLADKDEEMAVGMYHMDQATALVMLEKLVEALKTTPSN